MVLFIDNNFLSSFNRRFVRFSPCSSMTSSTAFKLVAALAFLVVAPLLAPSPLDHVAAVSQYPDLTVGDGDPGLGLKESRSGFADFTLAFLFASSRSSVAEDPKLVAGGDILMIQ